MSQGDNVILSKSEFEKMTDRIQDQADLIKELKEANEFLNNQIKEYNEKFAKREGDDNE
jgi:cell division protein FtsB